MSTSATSVLVSQVLAPAGGRLRPVRLAVVAWVVAWVAAAGTGCSTSQQTAAVDAATTPLNDLNLLQAKIPEPLEAARKAPYKLAAEVTCEALTAEIQGLDELLGPDIDAPPDDDRPTLIDRLSDEASGAATGAIRRTAEGVVPFRGWIRKLTGAERHSKRVVASITAGGMRRAFLKGVRSSRGCGA